MGTSKARSENRQAKRNAYANSKDAAIAAQTESYVARSLKTAIPELTAFGDAETYRHYGIQDGKVVSEWRNKQNRDREGITLDSEKPNPRPSISIEDNRMLNLQRLAGQTIHLNGTTPTTKTPIHPEDVKLLAKQRSEVLRRKILSAID